jgi:hypothetical protein
VLADTPLPARGLLFRKIQASVSAPAAVHAYSDDGVSAVMRQPVIRERQIRGTNNVLGVAPIN